MMQPQRISPIASLSQMRVRWLALLLLQCGIVGASANAAADEPSNRPLAQRLFEQGREQMRQGNLAEGCRLLADSQRIEPATGTLINLALCHERNGEVATAWIEFEEVRISAKRNGDDERAQIAKKHAALLLTRLPKLTISPDTISKLPNPIFRLDGKELSKGALSYELPIDPGQHVLSVEVPGKKPFLHSFLAHEGERIAIGNISFSDESPVAAPPPKWPFQPAPVATGERASSVQATSTPPTGRRIAAYSALGVGAAALCIGGYFGIQAFQDWNERNVNCPQGACNLSAVQAGERAQQSAMIANVSIGIGLVAAGVSTYLFLTMPSDRPRSAATWQRATGTFEW